MIDISGGSVVMPTVKGEYWHVVYIVTRQLQLTVSSFSVYNGHVIFICIFNTLENNK